MFCEAESYAQGKYLKVSWIILAIMSYAWQ